jgi:hypothetical protein
MREMREITASTNVKIAANPFIQGICASCIMDSGRSHRQRASRGASFGARCADSESRFLAIKKFSGVARHRLIGTRQNRIFQRIEITDSLAGFFARRGAAASEKRSIRRFPRSMGRTRARSEAELARQ